MVLSHLARFRVVSVTTNHCLHVRHRATYRDLPIYRRGYEKVRQGNREYRSYQGVPESTRGHARVRKGIRGYAKVRKGTRRYERVREGTTR